MTAAAVLARIWGFLRSPLGRVLGSAVAILALLWAADARGYRRGVADERGAWEARIAEADERARRLEAAWALHGERVGAQVAVNQAEARTVTRTLIEKVPIYVRPEDDRRCVVGPGFVQLHDAAAAGLPDPAQPAGGAADAGAGVALSAVAATVAENYGACRENTEQLKGWQAWWAGITATDR